MVKCDSKALKIAKAIATPAFRKRFREKANKFYKRTWCGKCGCYHDFGHSDEYDEEEIWNIKSY